MACGFGGGGGGRENSSIVGAVHTHWCSAGVFNSITHSVTVRALHQQGSAPGGVGGSGDGESAVVQNGHGTGGVLNDDACRYRMHERPHITSDELTHLYKYARVQKLTSIA